jgi:hypothetical protein
LLGWTFSGSEISLDEDSLGSVQKRSTTWEWNREKHNRKKHMNKGK